MDKSERLIDYLRGNDGLAVSFSGGVDSSLVLWAARRAQPDRCLAVIIDSPSLARRDMLVARDICADIGAPLSVLLGGELEDPRYVENSRERCYFCKFHGYGAVVAEARRRNLARILDGTNVDDTGDWRPGRRAAAEFTMKSPLLELGFTKADVREVARTAGLSNWDKPAAPCLASRVPHGETVDREKLSQIENAEDILRRFGFQELRVRHFGQTASVELPHADWPEYLRQKSEIEGELAKQGFSCVELFAGGLRSGRLSHAT